MCGDRCSKNSLFFSKGLGQVNATGVILKEHNFFTDPPTFTLLATSRNGPPTTSIWRRNGVPIKSNSSFTINVNTPCLHDQQACINSIYEGTLNVNGNLPGEYQYSVTNRARNGSYSSASINIQGL